MTSKNQIESAREIYNSLYVKYEMNTHIHTSILTIYILYKTSDKKRKENIVKTFYYCVAQK